MEFKDRVSHNTRQRTEHEHNLNLNLEATVREPHRILYLQRQLGNRAVQRLMAGKRAGDVVINERKQEHVRVIPIQRNLATQFTLEPDKPNQIKDMIIIGRPKSPFSGTMGDHSTAFEVQLNAVRSRINGKTFKEAYNGLNELTGELKNLPGYKLLELNKSKKVNSTQAKKRIEMIAAAFQELKQKQTDVANAFNKKNPDQALLISGLQQYVNAYLEVRELIPLSTTNIKSKFPALAGKGKGESSGMKQLKELEVNKSTNKDEIKEAIFKVFDAKSAAIVAAEQEDSSAEQMSPGITDLEKMDNSDRKETDSLIRVRLRLFVQQHIASIVQSFPNLLITAKLTQDEIRSYIEQKLQQEISDQISKELEYVEKELKLLNEKLKFPEFYMNRNPKNYAKNADDYISNLKKQIEMFSDTKSNLKEVSKFFPVKKQIIGKQKREKKKNKKQKKEKKKENKNNKPTLASQLVLDEKGQIADYRSEGRSPSPHKNTMGAHTTAWIVYLDRIRVAIKGKTLDQAITTVCDVLIPEAKDMNKNHSKLKIKLSIGQVNLLSTAEENLDNMLTALKSVKSDNTALQLDLLQKILNQYLTFINYIPGVTLDSANTSGNTEGTYRKRIMKYENMNSSQSSRTLDSDEKKGLQEAFINLMDLDAVKEEHKSYFFDHHLEMIKKAYPKAYNLSNMNNQSVKDKWKNIVLTQYQKKSNKSKKRKNSDEYQSKPSKRPTKRIKYKGK